MSVLSKIGLIASVLRPLTIVPTTLLVASLAIPAQAVERNIPDQIAEVEMFAAMQGGEIDVKFIPKDSSEANLIVKNLTDKPLNIRLPEAFAGVPINAQMGMGGMGMGGMGGMGGGMGGMGGGMGGMGGGMGMGQAMGGGMGGMGGGMGGMGMGGGMGGMGGGMGGMGGMMRVAPERAQKMKVAAVCLEHDKPEPNPKMKYTIIPLEMVTKDERVHAVCKLLGRGQVAQNTAQAAAWHLTDEMSWQELAVKNRVESRYTGNVRFFSPIELRQAIAVVSYIENVVDDPASTTDGRYSSAE